jgi:hypothetical protein
MQAKGHRTMATEEWKQSEGAAKQLCGKRKGGAESAVTQKARAAIKWDTIVSLEADKTIKYIPLGKQLEHYSARIVKINATRSARQKEIFISNDFSTKGLPFWSKKKPPQGIRYKGDGGP